MRELWCESGSRDQACCAKAVAAGEDRLCRFFRAIDRGAPNYSQPQEEMREAPATEDPSSTVLPRPPTATLPPSESTT
eukprot:12426092-Karenia_brevis.AAC.1